MRVKNMSIVARDTKVQQWLTAARDGSHELATQLLEENPNLITAVDDEHKMTALHWATSTGQLGMVEFLLREKVELANAIDGCGMHALHWAASTRERALAVPLLLAANPASLHVLAIGMTPLDRAIVSDDVEVTAQFFAADPSLVRRGHCDLRLTYCLNSEGMTSLHIAAVRNRSTIVEQLLAMDPGLIKAVDSEGRTALDLAAAYGHWRVMGLILAEDPSLSSKGDKLCGGTALHCAARGGSTKGVAKLLARHPGMINAVDDEGRTALHWAAGHCSGEVITQLLAVAGPHVINAVSKNGETALQCAASALGGHYFDTVERLLDVMSPEAINAVDGKGKTVLYWAAWHGMDKLVARLLAMSPGLIDQVTHEGETVLHVSRNYATLEMVLALRPEMVHAVDNQGNTTLHSAVVSYGAKEFIERLVALIPDAMQVLNSKKQTPFGVAVARWPLMPPVVDVMLVKLSLDEAVSALHKVENYESRLLCPVLKKQCQVLLSVLNQDVVGVVFEYLGLDTLTRHKKRRF